MAAFSIGRHFHSQRISWWWRIPAVWVGFGVLWSFTQVFMLPLMLFQLGVILAASLWSMHLMQNASLKRRLREALEAAKQDLDQQQITALDAVRENELALLSTKREHNQAIDDAIAQARQTLCITSGWINDRATTPRRVAAIRTATQRGVHVFIVFGFRSRYEEPTLQPDARRVVSALHDLAQETRNTQAGKLVIAHMPVHSKVVVRDDQQAIIGSNNWLSNNAFVNEERSVVINNPAFATRVRDDVMRTAMQADANTIPNLLRKNSPSNRAA